jgi:uncharacterized repeat protein (TIGR01451 family)
MLSEQNFKKWLFTSLGLLLKKYSLVVTCSRSNCIKQLRTAYGYLTHVLVISVVSLVSFLGLSQQAQAHTAITKTTSTPLVAPGGTATYTINVTDAGTSSATTGITVTDGLPAGFTYLSTQSVNLVGGTTRPTTVNPTVGSNTPAWGTFTTPFPATPPNTFNITFDARVPIGGNCGKYDNAVTATATGGTHTYIPYTGTASTADDVTVTGTLSASKTTSTPTVVNTPTGTQATYTIVLTNTGQCTIPNVSLTDALPTGFTYLSTGAVGFTGGATRPSTTNPTAGTAAPVWSNFTLPSGGTVSLTFTAKIATSVVSGTYNNNTSATTTTAGITVTPYVGTSSNQEDVTVTLPSADLTITKTHIGNFTQGQTGATYTLTATNSGTAATSGTVSVVDTLPTGLTATAISGTSWICMLATLTCTRSDALAAGSSYAAITLTVDVAANAASSITNNATVSGGGEINTSNNSATQTTTVTAPANLTPDLRLVKRITAINGSSINTVIDPTTTLDPNDNAPDWPVGYLRGAIDAGIVRPTDEVEYTIYFLSDGDSPAKRVELCDLVPVNSTFIATTFNGLTPRDAGNLAQADTGIALSIGSTTPTVYLTNVGGDGQDRGQFLATTTALASCGAGSNTNGAVVVDVVTDTTTPSNLPNATAPGTPTNSYGFIRFRALVK